jgi:predicted O-linked N-acetylglucosamine transferase (SPINDLY family)
MATSMTVEETFQAAFQHHIAGDLPKAEALYRQVLTAKPEHAEALHLLGALAHQVGRNEVAEKLIRRAIARNPHVPGYYNNLGLALQALGKRRDAAAAYMEAIRLQPDFSKARANLGHLLLADGRWEESVAEFKHALRIDPTDADAAFAMGNALNLLNRLDEAAAAYRHAIQHRPDFVIAYANLGMVLSAQQKNDLAVAAYREALRIDPSHSQLHFNLGFSLRSLGNISASMEAYREAIRLRPDFAEAWNNLASLLKSQGRMDEAIEHYRKTLQLMPTASVVHSNLLFSCNLHPRSDAGLLDEHREWASRHAAAFERQAAAPMSIDRESNRKLRVGFLSGDFRSHAVDSFFQSVLGAPRPHWEAICYSNVLRPDAMTERLKSMADGWREIAGTSDERATQMIRDDRIDILFDLSGHTAENRLLVFARRAAPIQVTYLGYPNTTGLSTMDFRLTDADADPPGMTEAHHTEKLVRLAGGFLCYTSPTSSPAPRATPSSGPITFGTFNDFAKVTPAMLSTFARILRAVPDSRLLMKSEALSDAQVQSTLHARFAADGISEDRVVLLGKEPSFLKHLEAYHRIDIALDTFPYNGTTTTCEALWMGVPVVSLAGRAHVSRVGVSLLKRVGLSELIATDEANYVAVATKLAMDRERLEQISGERLRQRMQQSPLMDCERFGEAFWIALSEMLALSV